MKFFISLISICLCLQAQSSFVQRNTQINAETIKQLVFTEGDAYHHFIGVDPAKAKVPYFDMNALNKIDSLDYSYFLEINTKIYYSDLTLKHHSEFKDEANYAIFIEIIDDKGRTADQQFKEQQITIEKSALQRVAFKASKLKFYFALNPGDYTIKVLIEDKISGAKFPREIEFTQREWKHKDFLISDLEFYDTFTGEPIISLDNNLNNRKDFFVVQFQTYQRELEKNYTFSLDIYEKKMTIDKIGATLKSVGLGIVNFFKNLVSEDEPEVDEESIYIRAWENIRTAHFMQHADMIDKKLFDHIEFPKDQLPGKKLVARVVSTLHENERVALDELDEGEKIANIDSININEFDFDKEAVGDRAQITTATARIEMDSEFTLAWEFVPQTKEEMQSALDKMTYLDIDTLDVLEEMNLSDSQKAFVKIWTEYAADKKDYIHPLNGMQLYFRKLKFSVDNFPDIVQVNAGAVQGNRNRFTNNGWKSDKAKVYMKHGSPDEIHGDNIFNSEGQMIQHTERPPVQLWVYSDSGKKFWFKENFLITNN